MTHTIRRDSDRDGRGHRGRAAATAAQQPPPQRQPPPIETTRPPADNENTLRPLGPDEIAPNLSFYAMDPLYKPGIPLGWAKERIEEKLDRGLIAIKSDKGVYLGWRLLKSDPADVAFNVYRRIATKLTAKPLRTTTDFVDTSAAATAGSGGRNQQLDGRGGRERTRAAGVRGGRSSRSATRAIKLKEDVKGVDRVGIGDLNGDGTYDFVVKHPGGHVDPGRRMPSRDSYKIDAYDGRSGRFLWRVDLGWNIQLGIWFSPMVVRDLDGDGKAEVCLRTAPYAATREQAFPDNGKDLILQGPEYLSVYDGETGKEIDKTDWIERGDVTDWADRSGNRASRHMLGVAYLDGKTPSVLVVRGTYGLMKVDAWTLQDRKLRKIWRWTNERAPFMYQGQGQHSIKVGDIDGDGFDEILNGSLAIDNDGRTMWGTGLGHGDRFYLSDIDPKRPGLEIWYTIEEAHPRYGVSLWDAKNGTLIFGTPQPNADNQIAGGLVRRHRSGAAWRRMLGRQVLLQRDGTRHRRRGAAAERARVVGRRPASRDPHERLHLEMEGRGDRAHGRQRPARRRHPRRLARGDRHVRERRAAHPQHDHSREGSPRHVDAGSHLSPRCHASFDGLSARPDDELLSRR